MSSVGLIRALFLGDGVAADVSQLGVAGSPGGTGSGTARTATLVPATPGWEIRGLRLDRLLVAMQHRSVCEAWHGLT